MKKPSGRRHSAPSARTQHLQRYGLTSRDAGRLATALDGIESYAVAVRKAIIDAAGEPRSEEAGAVIGEAFPRVCAGLRLIVSGEEV